MTDIPDDVVERARAAYRDDYRDFDGTLAHERALRAALRVAVEWEREQCALVVDRWAAVSFPAEEAEAVSLAAAIRARGQEGLDD